MNKNKTKITLKRNKRLNNFYWKNNIFFKFKNFENQKGDNLVVVQRGWFPCVSNSILCCYENTFFK